MVAFTILPIASSVLLAIGLVWCFVPLSAVRRNLVSSRSPQGSGDAEQVARGQNQVMGSAVAGTETTFLLLVGDEPWEAIRPTVLMAAHAGPTIVVSARAADRGEDASAVPWVWADTVSAAVDEALGMVESPAVLVASARAIPDADGCRSAAAAIRDGAPFVVGSSLLRGSSRSATRDLVGERLRQHARATGLWMWEPDAVMISTDVLRNHPLESGRALGAWLRERSTDGSGGVASDLRLSRRSEPGGGPARWAFVIGRQRALVADLADAVRRSRGEQRARSLGLLARELWGLGAVAVSAPWWITVLTGSFPLPMPPVFFVGLLASVAAGRFLMLRRRLGVVPSPVADLWATLAALPGSIMSAPAAIRSRPLSRRAPAPSRPLVWMALFVTLLTGVGLVGQTLEERASFVSVAFSITTLVLMWVLGLRALSERSRHRGGLRVPVDVCVELEGVATVTVDGSVDGLSVRWPKSAPLPERGRRVDVVVSWSAVPFVMSAEVVSRRAVDSGHLVGLAVAHRDGVPGEWLTALGHALEAAPARLSRTPRVALAGRPRRRVGDLVLAGVGLAVSVAVVGALGLVLSGHQVLVVRSASMSPTIAIGDVVLMESVRADSVMVGDVVTRPASPEWGESLTHRVQRVTAHDGGLRVETRGDANQDPERWTVAPAEVVGRQVGQVPRVGAIVLALRSNLLQVVSALVLLIAGIVVIRRGAATARIGNPVTTRA